MKSIFGFLLVILSSFSFAQTTIVPTPKEFQYLESDHFNVINNELVFYGNDNTSMEIALPITLSGEANTIEYVVGYPKSDQDYWGGLEFLLSTGDVVYVNHSIGSELKVGYELNRNADYETKRDWKKIKSANGQMSIRIEADGKSFKISVNGVKEKSIKTLGGEISKIIAFTPKGASRSWKLTQLTANNVVFNEVKKIDLNLADKPQKLLVASSSEHSDLNPKITADGNAIFFTRDMENNKSMVCFKKSDGTYTEAQMLPYPINLTGKSVSIASAGVDGSTLYITGYRVGGANHPKKIGVSRTRRNSNGYEEFKPFEIKKYINLDKYRTHILSADNQFLLMGIVTPSSLGQMDLYVSILIQKSKRKQYYSEPINLGPMINTAGSEIFGFLAPDNKTLYFSSNGYHGYGDSDFYVAKRLDDTWTNWSTPVNLGPVINTPDWDGYFSTNASGDMALISATRDGDKNSDIYQVSLVPETKPDPVLIVSGRVLNKETNQPIDGEIQFRPISNPDAESKTLIANIETGEYKAIFQKGANYEILANKEGYFPTSDFIKLDSLELYGEITKNLYLTPIKKGEVIRLNNIFFDFAKSSLKEESYFELNRLYDLLLKNKKLRIEISGHTDNVGSESYNTNLSNERAQSVVNYLVSKGIDISRLSYKGYGPSKPIDTNDTEEGRANNRRVEFTIL